MSAIKKYDVIEVPLSPVKPGQEVKATNSTIQGILKKGTRADVVYYGIPDEKSNVFHRTITVVKMDRSDLQEGDHPDMNDLYDTDLPWCGYVTFNGASRQFRSKYALKTYLSIIKEYDGVLYQLVEGDFVTKHKPVLLRIDKHDVATAYVKVTIVDDTPDLVMKSLITSMAPPQALKDEMEAAGFVWEKDRFVTKDSSQAYSEVLCRVYGKFLPTSNGR